MDRTEIEKLMPACRPDEQVKLSALYNGYIKALEGHQAEKAAGTLRALEAAEKALRRMVDEVQARSVDVVFEGVPAVLGALAARGYKIKKSKLYADAKAGLLRAEAGGKTFRESEVLAYALRAGLKVKDSGHQALDEHSVKRARLEVELLEIKREREHMALEKDRGEYVRKSEVVVEFAGRLAMMEAFFKHLVRTRAVDWIYAVGGDVKKADMLCELANAEVDTGLTEIANLDEIGISFKMEVDS